ncbi:MAG: uroporphyrinogen decarboxylase [Alphaproteobacteria bacterium]|nr:uroporphyrinogen decarboxylase [Alphaproteobacteria bacterium]
MTAPKLLRVLSGESVWPPPVWLMRQAGRYLPEYRAIRERAGDFIALCTRPDLAAEVTLQPVRRYGLDAAILFSDILMVPWALGYQLSFQEGEGPVLPPYQPELLDMLVLDRLPEAIRPIAETVQGVRAVLDGAVPLIGFAGGPFTVAGFMVEGGSSSHHSRLRAFLYEQPTALAGLIDRLTEATVAYLQAQVAAGAQVLMLFESWAGLLSPTAFRRHVIAPIRTIVTAVKASSPSVPVIGFPRLAGSMLGEFVRSTGVDGVGLDWVIDPGSAAAQVLPCTALQGNLDPMALKVGGAALTEETNAILQALRGRPHVFNLGHGVLPDTPPDHVARLVDLIRAA